MRFTGLPLSLLLTTLTTTYVAAQAAEPHYVTLKLIQHDLDSGDNTYTTGTETRNDGIRRSMLYEFAVPRYAAFRTCTPHFKANETQGDMPDGAQMDVYSLATGGVPLADFDSYVPTRGPLLARITYDEQSGTYKNDASPEGPLFRPFPCPEPDSLVQWEAAPVGAGAESVNFVYQADKGDYELRPKGLSINY